MLAIEKYRPLIRRIAVALGIAVIFLSLGSISIPINRDAVLNEIKAVIERDFGPITAVDGQTNFRFLPHPAIEISNLSLSFNNKIKVDSPKVSFSLSVFSLLGGRYEMVSSTLTAPHVSIPSELMPQGPEALAESLSSLVGTSQVNLVATANRHLENITINDGVVDVEGDHSKQVDPTKITASLYFLSDGARGIAASGQWRRRDVKLNADLGPLSTMPEKGRTASVFISSTLGTISLSGESPSDKNILFLGRIVADISRIDQVSQWLDIAPPVAFPTSLKIDGKATMTPLAIGVADAQVKLGAVAMTGGIALDISGPRPLITGTLSAGDMDITSFLTPIWPKQSDLTGWKIAPVDPNLTPNQDLDIRLSAERINLGIVRISNAALSIMAKDRNLNITLASARLFQGSLKGKILLRPIEDGFSLVSHGSFETIDIGQATLALMDMRKLEGSISGKIDVEATGPSIDKMMKSLSGQADLSMINGTLSGVNISTILKRIETRPLSVIRDMRGGKTDFETMIISAHIANGIASLDEAEMVFQPNKMKLKGTIYIGERQINLTGEAVGPPPQNDAEPAVLAYSVTGSFDEPVVTPDINRILKRSGSAVPTPE